MIVGPVVVEESEGKVRRRAEVRWRDGELELFSLAPSSHADTSDDLTGFLAVTLPLAMRRHEPLEGTGPVSPRFLDTIETLQECYTQWHPDMIKVEVSAPRGAPREPRGGRGAFLSRGVDSLFAAAREGDRLSAAVHVVGLEPVHDEHVREEEAVLAGRAAAVLGLETVVVHTNVRELSDPVFGDWEDFVAPGLAFCAHALTGGLRALLIASCDIYATIEPCGTSPLLDPLYSSEAMAVEHSPLTHSRLRKLVWLADHRPDLLAHIKVCFAENRTDNCGHCGKCTLTMGGLRVAGALESASQFPPDPDPAALDALRMSRAQSRLDWTELAAALGPEDPFGTAIRGRLEQTRPAGPLPLASPVSLRDHHRNALLSRIFGPGGERLGLVRAVDGERHRYGVGTVPLGVLVGELGALHAAPQPGSVPLWITADGFLVSASGPPTTPRPRRVRWVAAPLRWGMTATLRAKTPGAIAWRLARARRPLAPVASATGPPVGYVHTQPAEGRLPLYSARHAITGDQMLSTEPTEAGDCGYGPAVLLGHLEAAAPITRVLGITARPHLVWASRFGRLVRPG